uniref:Uncharacterized protein n=1 Tax=Salix viminalis TaxID=40686 RepID=A0A6N2NFF1_SALVM
MDNEIWSLKHSWLFCLFSALQSVEFLWRLSLTILLVSAITSSSTAAFLKRNSSPIFNATVGEGNEEEFSMESEVHQRLIASQSQFIGYRSLENNQFAINSYT